MISLGFTSYEMEIWFSDLFTSYDMELEIHVHVQIENHLGVSLTTNCMLSLGLTSYEMELETHGHVHIENQIGFHEHQIA